MKSNSLLATLVVALTLAGAAGTADARPRPRQGKSFEANKSFGLGLEFGAPFGLTGKYFLSQNTALQFGVGSIYHYRDREGLHLYLDHLWHPVSLASTPAFELPLYIGVGARIWAFDHYRGPYDGDDALALGLRVPVGIAFDFNNVPLDIFVQLAFVLDFYTGDYYRDVYGDVNGTVGIRYWF